MTEKLQTPGGGKRVLVCGPDPTIDAALMLAMEKEMKKGEREIVKLKEEVLEVEKKYFDMVKSTGDPKIGDRPFTRQMFKGNSYVKPHAIGRNDPCYCGSARKYKKCCEPKDLAAKVPNHQNNF